MRGKVILITMDNQGNYQGTVFNSYERADQVRSVMDEKGIETFGIIRVVTLSEAVLG